MVLHRSKRRDVLLQILAVVLLIFAAVHLVFYAGKSFQGPAAARVRRDLGKRFHSFIKCLRAEQTLKSTHIYFYSALYRTKQL